MSHTSSQHALCFALATQVWTPHGLAQTTANFPDASAADPTCEELQTLLRAAEAVAARRDRSGELSDRARWSGLLPNVRVVGRAGTAFDWAARGRSEQDLSQTTSQGDSGSIALALTFRLDRLLFAQEELRADQARLRHLQWVDERLSGVIAAYCERQRLVWERSQGVNNPVRALRIRELDTLLDLFTDGAWSQQRHAHMLAPQEEHADAASP